MKSETRAKYEGGDADGTGKERKNQSTETVQRLPAKPKEAEEDPRTRKKKKRSTWNETSG